MLNAGYIEIYSNGVTARVYYDTTFTPVGPDQPLINGPRGYCLDISNPTGKSRKVTAGGQSGTVSAGDLVTVGKVRSRTAAQLATAGFATRGQVSLALE